MWIPHILHHPGMLQLSQGSRGGKGAGKCPWSCRSCPVPAQELLLNFLGLGMCGNNQGRQKSWSVKHTGSQLLAQLQPTGISSLTLELLGAAIPVLHHSGKTFQTFFFVVPSAGNIKFRPLGLPGWAAEVLFVFMDVRGEGGLLWGQQQLPGRACAGRIPPPVPPVSVETARQHSRLPLPHAPGVINNTGIASLAALPPGMPG